MTQPSLQEAIDEAGSPVKLKWKANAGPASVPIVKPEFFGWSAEQSAWRTTAAFFDLSHHMSDLFLYGPGAMRLLAETSANDYVIFAIGQAKQFIPVTQRGMLITDGILVRNGEESFTLTGGAASQNWVRYHATRRHDVEVRADPDSRTRGNETPVLFRYQVQGPNAVAIVERAFGGPLPKLKFFHSAPVELDGVTIRAFRHGMAGQAGYEFIGNWQDAEHVRQRLLSAGKELDIVPVGGMAYYTNGLESGWIPTPTQGIFTDPELDDYRRFVPLQSPEGMIPLYGSHFSQNIEDYYVSPFEMGYGKMVNFSHDFIGRDALLKASTEVQRKKVTLVFDDTDMRQVLGKDFSYFLSYPRDRVEVNGELIGLAMYEGHIGPLGKVLGLALIDEHHAQPGTRVTVAWGRHPGPGTPPEAHEAFPRVRATVQPAPYDAHARATYRQ